MDGLTANQEIVTTAVYGMGLDEGMAVTGMPMAAMNGGAAGGTEPGGTAIENEADLDGTATENEAADSTQRVTEDISASQEQTEEQTDNG